MGDQRTAAPPVSKICLTQGLQHHPSSNRFYPERIVVAAEGNILCEHRRIIERTHHVPGRTVYDWRHYLAVIQRKPGALRNGAPFVELPAAFRQL
jgi:hypothetical protein